MLLSKHQFLALSVTSKFSTNLSPRSILSPFKPSPHFHNLTAHAAGDGAASAVPPFAPHLAGFPAASPPKYEVEVSGAVEDLGDDSEVFKKTLRLVECAMFASVGGLAYFLSNSLAIENYFGCFFPLPIVISSMRWGVAASRKTMVATVMLLFTLAGPVKAMTYMLMHGLLGVAMGTLFRLQSNWTTSVLLCTLVRATGAVGYVLLSSFLIRENILSLITINIHASLTYVLTAMGANLIPSMNAIYTIFGILVLLNCGFFVFLLHILYSVFLTKFGMKSSLALPGWLKKAL